MRHCFRADPTWADLSGSNITKGQLAEYLSLDGVFMPDGSKHD